jgi:hypothetical protein
VFDDLCTSRDFTPLTDPVRHTGIWPMSFRRNALYWERNTDWYLRLPNTPYPTHYFNSYNHFLDFVFEKPNYPKYAVFAPGANYIVPREVLLKYPKQFYENLRAFVSHTPEVVPGESHLIERALYTIWTTDMPIHENMRKPLPADFTARPPRILSPRERVENFFLARIFQIRWFFFRARGKIRRILGL